jgi:Ankyrin repeats (3 copies)
MEEKFFKLLDLNPWRAEKVDEETFLPLIATHPELLRKTYRFDAFDDEDLYPLHMVCALSASSDCVKAVYKACPYALDDANTELGGPIHYACSFGAGVDVIRYLTKKNTDAAALLLETNRNGHTPLHLACIQQTHRNDPDVVVFLTERCRDAARKLDNDGCTPLHLACAAADEPIVLAVIEDLTEVHPGAGTVKAACDGTWPLWNAMAQPDVESNTAVLKDLIVSNPESVKLLHERSGATILHRAISTEQSLSIVKDCCKVYPQGLKHKDCDGRIPLHLAIELKAASALIRHLVTKCPESVEIENERGEIAHVMADRLGLNEDIVTFLNPYEEVDDAEA